MELIKEKKNELAGCLLDIGAALLSCGAEISRVEDTMCRIGMAYGAEHVDAFVITSMISLSMEFGQDDIVTETRRIISGESTDFTRLEELNALSRRCCYNPLTLPELRADIDAILSLEKSRTGFLLGSIIAAGSFSLFFGGNMPDALVSALFACIVCMIQAKLGKTRVNIIGFNLILSMLTGLGVGFICALFPALHMDMIMIGDIMLMIPGLAITNAVRNILGGNTISGVVRLTECLVWAGSLAGGFMTAMLIVDIVLGA